MIMDFQFERWDEDYEDPNYDLCHYETAISEDQNGSSPDPGSVREDEYDNGLSEHSDVDTDVEEEEEDGDDEVTQSQLSDEDDDSTSEEGSSEVTHGTTTYTMLKRSDDVDRYGPMKERVSHHVPPNQKRQQIVRMRGGAPDEDQAGCK